MRSKETKLAEFQCITLTGSGMFFLFPFHTRTSLHINNKIYPIMDRLTQLQDGIDAVRIYFIILLCYINILMGVITMCVPK